jgi:hypothetical protein
LTDRQKKPQQEAAERRERRRQFITEFSKELHGFGRQIDSAKAFVKASSLRELTREEVELMKKRAEDRAQDFEHRILKPLRLDLKRREQEKRTESRR